MGTNMEGFDFNEDPAEELKPKAPDSNPIDDPGVGQYSNSDKVFANATDPSSATQAALNTYGHNARENLNEGSLKRAQSGEDYNKNMQYGSNIPVEGPFANYNNMSWDQTQRLSRLADAYNASHRWTPGNFNADGSGQISQYVKQDPVQTEEMRRGDLTRQGLGQQQSLALNRADRILTHPQQLTEMFDQVGLQADQAHMEIMRNFSDYAQRAQHDMEFRAKFEQALQKDMLRYTQKLAYYEKSKVATILYNQMANNHEYAQWLSSNLTNSVLPQLQQHLANKVAQHIYSSNLAQGMDYQQILVDVNRIIGDITGAQAMLNQQQQNYVMGQALGNIGTGWFGGGYTK